MYVLHWLVRDQANPLLQQFAVVPMTLSQSIGAFLEEISDTGIPKTMGKHLDKCCQNNHHILSGRFVINGVQEREVSLGHAHCSSTLCQDCNINGLEADGAEITGYTYTRPLPAK